MTKTCLPTRNGLRIAIWHGFSRRLHGLRQYRTAIQFIWSQP
jgi:hypothetical protein